MTKRTLASSIPSSYKTILNHLQQQTFEYFIHEANPANGLVRDKSKKGWPSSIAATGLALAAYPIGVKRAFISRTFAAKRTLATLRFFWKSPQGTNPLATGYKGFYYHFLDMRTGRRAWESELSTIDSSLLLAGVLAAGTYFDKNTDAEREIRDLAEKLYLRANWKWAQDGSGAVSQGWTPGRGKARGFFQYRWHGYSEALLLYILGLGSPTHPLPQESYKAWTDGFEWKSIFGHKFLYAGPLFIHQLSHCWLDLRGIQDHYMRRKRIDYFENSRRATLVQQQYAIRNPRKFSHYSKYCWGITASDGPGPATRTVAGVKRTFFDYVARGVPDGPDDGTISPWAAVTSLPFAPEIVLPTIKRFDGLQLLKGKSYGFEASFNPTFPERDRNPNGWVSPWHFGLNQGPIVLMIENYRTGLLWKLMKNCPYIVTGLRRAGFKKSVS